MTELKSTSSGHRRRFQGSPTKITAFFMIVGWIFFGLVLTFFFLYAFNHFLLSESPDHVGLNAEKLGNLLQGLVGIAVGLAGAVVGIYLALYAINAQKEQGYRDSLNFYRGTFDFIAKPVVDYVLVRAKMRTNVARLLLQAVILRVEYKKDPENPGNLERCKYILEGLDTLANDVNGLVVADSPMRSIMIRRLGGGTLVPHLQHHGLMIKGRLDESSETLKKAVADSARYSMESRLQAAYNAATQLDKTNNPGALAFDFVFLVLRFIQICAIKRFPDRTFSSGKRPAQDSSRAHLAECVA